MSVKARSQNGKGELVYAVAMAAGCSSAQTFLDTWNSLSTQTPQLGPSMVYAKRSVCILKHWIIITDCKRYEIATSHTDLDSIWRDQLKRCTRYLNVIANAAHTIDRLGGKLKDIVYNSN